MTWSFCVSSSFFHCFQLIYTSIRYSRYVNQTFSQSNWFSLNERARVACVNINTFHFRRASLDSIGQTNILLLCFNLPPWSNTECSIIPNSIEQLLNPENFDALDWSSMCLFCNLDYRSDLPAMHVKVERAWKVEWM